MKSQRGFSLVEILVAAGIGAGVALVVSVFFLMTLRVTRDANAQAALQRQGTAIAEELGRRARPVVGSLVAGLPATGDKRHRPGHTESASLTGRHLYVPGYEYTTAAAEMHAAKSR